MNYKTQYINLGKLLYAIAYADGKIEIKEEQKLHNILKSRFVPTEGHKDEFGVNDAWYAEFEFDTLKERNVKAESAFNSFIEYIQDNKQSITPEFRSACIGAAEGVASAFHHINKDENKYIARLKEELLS